MSNTIVVCPARRFSRIIATLLLLTTSLSLLAIASGSALAEPQPAPMWLNAATMPVTGTSFYMSGGVNVSDDLTGRTVSISKREMGQNNETLLTELPLSPYIVGSHFSATLPGLTHSAILTATWAGNAEYSPSSVWTFVRVRAKVTLQVKANTATYLRLRSEITPLQPLDAPAFGLPSPLLLFQCRVDGKWRSMGWGDTGSTDRESWIQATYYHLKPGTYVLRARFVGTDYNTAAVSKTLRVTVR